MDNPKPKKLLTLTNFTILFGLIGHLAVYIQAFKIIFLKSAYAVSLTGTLFAFVSLLFWLAYGISQKVRPLVITNLFGLVGIVILIASILYYGSYEKSS